MCIAITHLEVLQVSLDERGQQAFQQVAQLHGCQVAPLALVKAGEQVSQVHLAALEVLIQGIEQLPSQACEARKTQHNTLIS